MCIRDRGGTILGTKRTPFKLMRVVEDDKIDKVAAMKKTYKDAKLDCLLCLGGNGTHKTVSYTHLGHIFPDHKARIFAICCNQHFYDDSDCFPEYPCSFMFVASDVYKRQGVRFPICPVPAYRALIPAVWKHTGSVIEFTLPFKWFRQWGEMCIRDSPWTRNTKPGFSMDPAKSRIRPALQAAPATIL